eukprot:13410868-Ditylum_brightwellii.AAC.1
MSFCSHNLSRSPNFGIPSAKPTQRVPVYNNPSRTPAVYALHWGTRPDKQDLLKEKAEKPTKTLISSGPPSKWTAATNHLLQQSGRKGKFDLSWILLDSQSTVNVVCNAALLVSIHCSDYSLDIYSTAGKSTTDLHGDLPGFGMVWFYPEGIANILSLVKMAKMFPITYDSTDGQGFLVHKPDGSVQCLKKSKTGYFIQP